MIKKYFIVIFVSLFFNTFIYAAGGSSDSKVKKLKNYDLGLKKVLKAKKLEKKGKIKKAKVLYKEALEKLLEANKEKALDPDTLNYLGFTSRKIGDFENAEIYYLLGLDQDPTHNGINEYLGELYLETNRIDKAKERLKILEDCDCKEFNELQTSIKQGSSKY